MSEAERDELRQFREKKAAQAARREANRACRNAKDREATAADGDSAA